MPWKETEVMKLREEFVLKALGNVMSFADLCAEYAVSRKTGYKWMERLNKAVLELCITNREDPRVVLMRLMSLLFANCSGLKNP